jgi:enoyl-CoA hydratase/carnithine racemase
MRPAELDALFVEARKIIVDFLEVEQPIIAAVNGPATGLGATLALFSDVIFASEGARIGDPHVRIGVVAGDGGAIIWPWLVGAARAKEFLMTGDLLTAEEAHRIGLVNHVVPADQLLARALALADRLANLTFWTDPEAALGWLERVGSPGSCPEAISRAYHYRAVGKPGDARRVLAACKSAGEWAQRCVRELSR